MREFTAGEISSLRFWNPEALVAPLHLALALAERKQRGLFDLPSLDTALVVLTSIEDSPFGDRERDLLWRAFQVPLFEQLLGSGRTVIASECEVHDGLHMSDRECLSIGEILRDPCPCGKETPRVRRPGRARVRAAAAG